MLTIQDLLIYPIKSLGGVSVSEALVEEKGFRYDRRYMLVTTADDPDGEGKFITQRTHHHMTLIDVSIVGERLHVWHRHQPGAILALPLDGPAGTTAIKSVSVWDSEDVGAITVSAEADQWFSNALGRPCQLVFMPDTTRRPVEPKYALRDEEGQPSAVSFADGFPYLLIGQASLDELNRRLDQPIGMERFRPNLVVSGSEPYAEDSWYQFRVDNLSFYGVKPCARCVLTTIDPQTGQKGKEPLKTLATYRQFGHKILFGQNVLATGQGMLRVGQSIEIIEQREPWLAPPVPAVP